MFSEKSLTSSGKHLVCDIKNIKNTNVLNNLQKIIEIFDTICQKYEYQVLQKIEHIFDPQGFSVIYLLSESHISIHTFPEKNYAAIDLYTCRNYQDDSVYKEIYKYLIQEFDAKMENPIIINRNF